MGPLDWIYVQGYRFVAFAKNMAKKWSSKYGQKLLDATKNPAIDALKTALKLAIQKAAKSTSNLDGNKTPEKITKSISTCKDKEKSVQPTQMPNRI